MSTVETILADLRKDRLVEVELKEAARLAAKHGYKLVKVCDHYQRSEHDEGGPCVTCGLFQPEHP